MPTDVISKIGATNSPTTMDYTTLQSWEDACPANLVTDDKRWIGECYDQGELYGTTGLLLVSGQTTDSTRYVLLRCATGASFRDKAGVRTTALNYNASNGVAIRTQVNYYNTTVQNNTDYSRFEGLQISINSGTSNEAFVSNGAITRISDCILRGLIALQATGSYSGLVTTTTITNSLIIVNGTSGFGIDSFAKGVDAFGCTLINLSGGSATALRKNYSNVAIKNCAVFGFTTLSSGSGGGSVTHTYSATDDATMSGTGNVTSLTLADQFENSASDFRAVSTGDLQAGTPDSTNTPNDISGTARDATTPWIGCWEVVAAGGGSYLPLDTAHCPQHQSIMAR